MDNSATTRVSKEAAEKALYMMTECYGNPSSLHSKGFAAEKEMTAAREIIAERLSAQPGEIYFTSGGTESDNIAILGAVHAKKRAGNKIVTTAIEHPAVLNTMAQLEKEGFEVVYVQPDADGNILKEKFDAAIDAKTILVSVMAVNNETGVLLPLKDIAGMIKRKKAPALFHTDAVQGFCKIPLQPKKLGVDLISVSGHKVHAPKGVGALYVRGGIPLVNVIEGGAQERGKRAGTENVPGIAGMAAALEEACAHMEENRVKVTALRDRLIQGLSKIPHSAVNGDLEHRLPGNVNFCFEGIEGESLLLLLDAAGICASSGSACTSGSLDPSHVLLAIGRPHEVAHGSLRLSLCEENTEAEVDTMLREIPKVVEYLRNMSPVWRELQKGARDYVIQ